MGALTILITNGVDTVEPILVDGYDARRETRTLLITVLGATSRAVSFRPAGLRTGTLRMLFETHTEASACLDLLCGGAALDLSVSDDSEYDMTFVAINAPSIELDDDTRGVWWAIADFEEVA